MLEFLPQAVRDGLAQARKQSMRRGNRLSVHDGETIHRINRLWDDGFAVDAKSGPRLPVRVSIYDGTRHLYQCLVIDSADKGEERVFEFKWLHAIPDRPPADFVREADAPIAMISKGPTGGH